LTPVQAQDTPAGSRSHLTPADYGPTTRTRTATSSTLPPFLLSWYEHTATIRQHPDAAHPTPAQEPATTALVREPIAEPTPDTATVGIVRLKALLRERHWQSYPRFCREYDKAAATIDASLKGTYPSRAQHYRWLSGQVTGTPYPHHCEVLEAMFPGYTAAQLMAMIP
jgi:hypothetical protein